MTDNPTGHTGKPISLAPLTPEEALRKAMQFKPPAPPKKPAKAAKGKKK